MFSSLRGKIIDMFFEVQDEKKQAFCNDIEKMPGEHRLSEIKHLVHQYNIDAKRILEEIIRCLQVNSPQDLKKYFEADAKKYEEYYKKTGNEMFYEANQLFVSMSKYIEKTVQNYKKKLIKILLKYPGIEQKRQHIAKGFAREFLTSSHQQNRISPSDEVFREHIKTILENATISPEEKIKHIQKYFMSTFGFQKMSWKTFYRKLGLEEAYVDYIKEINLSIIMLLITLKECEEGKAPNTSPEKIKKTLEREIDVYLPKEQQKYPHPKIVGSITLPPTQKKVLFHQTGEEQYQEETTDPLILVGQQLSLKKFLSLFSLGYKEIDEYIANKKPLPARYYNSVKGKNGTLHFFTIGTEMKGTNSVLINVSVLHNEKTFKENEIYELVLMEKFLSDKREDPKRQTYIIRGVLKEQFKDYSCSAGQKLGDYEIFKKLLENSNNGNNTMDE